MSESAYQLHAESAKVNGLLSSGEQRTRYDQEKLLGVAVAVFNERGYDATSLEDLSTAIGLSKSSIYHYMDGKEHLLLLGLERALEPLSAIMEEPPTPPGQAAERLSLVIRRLTWILSDRLPFVTLLIRVRGNTPMERWALRRRRSFDAFMAALVQQAIDEGALRRDLEAPSTARLIMGMINSLAEWHRPGVGHPPDELADLILSTIFDGIRRPSRHHD